MNTWGCTIPSLLLSVFLLESGHNTRGEALDTWFVRVQGTAQNWFYDLASGNGSFVAVGTGGVKLTSTNGSNWVKGSFGNSAEKNCIGFGNGYFFSASKFAPSGDTNNTIIATNSSDWMGLFASNYLNAVYGADYVGGNYFLVGNRSTILTASNFDLSCAGSRTNNCNWILRNSGGNRSLEGAAFGNGVYVVVGQDICMRSADLVSWTVSTNFSARLVSDVAFANGLFVASADRAIYTSTNGETWSMKDFTNSFNRVVFANGTFLTVGSGGSAYSSFDGVDWVRHATGVSVTLTGLTFGNGTFVACGIDGTMIQSAPLGIPPLRAAMDAEGGGIKLSLSGELGRSYRIQARTNLAEGYWEDFHSFTNTAPVMEFLDTSVTNLPSRFYRAVSP